MDKLIGSNPSVGLPYVTSHDIKPEWLDYYGHMNEGYYLVCFSDSMWDFQEILGLGQNYTRETHNAIYTVESHIKYLAEVRGNATVTVSNQVTDFGPKKLKTIHWMEVNRKVVATLERVSLNYNQQTQNVTIFPDATIDHLRLNRAQGVALSVKETISL